MKEPTYSIGTRATGQGARTYATLINPDGSEYYPEKSESSKTGNHGTDYWFGDVSHCLKLITDFSNSGKDNSFFNAPDALTPEQTAALEKFKEEHFLD